MKKFLFLAVTLSILSNMSFGQIVTSDFANGDEGWTCGGDVFKNPHYISTNGNPGGYICNIDSNLGIVWYWVAPSKFLGNQSSKYGKTLMYDLIQSTVTDTTGDDIVIEGNGLRLLYRANYQPTTAWTSFSVSLIESAGWYLDVTGNPAPTKSQMQSVLSNITGLKIRAEYSLKKDTDGLDNVIFGKPKYYPGSGNAGFFDGINNYISLGNSNVLKPTAQLTVECWGLFRDLSGQYRLISNTDNGGYNISYNPSDSKIYFYLRVNGVYKIVLGEKPSSNAWHHYALTYDGRYLKGYIDGILQQTIDAGGNYPISYANNSTLIGADAGTADSPDNTFPYLNGYVDEVSIWNKALTQTQIRDWMCRKIKKNHPAYSNLLAYYKFDEERSDIKLFDERSAVAGTLRNGTVFESSGVPIGDTSSYVYNSNTVYLTHPDGDSINVQVASDDPDGIHIYRVDQAPLIKKGIRGLGPNDRYFGVFNINDTSTVNKIVYSYKGNPYVTTSAEPGLKLYGRNNNADIKWAGLKSVLNTSTKKLTVNNNNQESEYILGALDTALHAKSIVSVSDIIITEGNSSSKQAKFILQLNEPMNGTAFVDFKTQDSTAKTANNDYKSTSGTAKFEPGHLNDTILVRIYGDVIPEPNEFFKLLLKDPVNIFFTDSVGICQIKNDDATFSASEMSSSVADLKVVVPTLLSRSQVWQIRGINNFKTTVMLFDEKGVKVFSQNNYRNNATLQHLNSGIYFYKLILADPSKSGQLKEYNGKIVLTE